MRERAWDNLPHSQTNKDNKRKIRTNRGYPSSLTMTGFPGHFLRGNSPRSRAWAGVSTCPSVPWRLAEILLPQTLQASAVNQRVVSIVPKIFSWWSTVRQAVLAQACCHPKAKELNIRRTEQRNVSNYRRQFMDFSRALKRFGTILTKKLKTCGLEQSKFDPCLFLLKQRSSVLSTLMTLSSGARTHWQSMTLQCNCVS